MTCVFGKWTVMCDIMIYYIYISDVFETILGTTKEVNEYINSNNLLVTEMYSDLTTVKIYCEGVE